MAVLQVGSGKTVSGPVDWHRTEIHELHLVSACPILLLVLASAAPAPAEAVERCRAAHAADPAAHIACLEDALRNRGKPQPAEEIGQDQIKARERASADVVETVQIQIVSVEYDARGRGTLRTAEGQVWRETELIDRRPRLSTTQEYKARIERGMLGGYRLYVDGVRWMYKVERLE